MNKEQEAKLVSEISEGCFRLKAPGEAASVVSDRLLANFRATLKKKFPVAQPTTQPRALGQTIYSLGRGVEIRVKSGMAEIARRRDKIADALTAGQAALLAAGTRDATDDAESDNQRTFVEKGRHGFGQMQITARPDGQVDLTLKLLDEETNPIRHFTVSARDESFEVVLARREVRKEVFHARGIPVGHYYISLEAKSGECAVDLEWGPAASPNQSSRPAKGRRRKP